MDYDELICCPKCNWPGKQVGETVLDLDEAREVWTCEDCGTVWRVCGEVAVDWTHRQRAVNETEAGVTPALWRQTWQ